MFPGVQHYMSPMGIGMGHGAMPSVHGPIPFPRVPLVSQSMPSNPTVGQASVFPPFASPVNFQNQIQSAYMPESYTHYLGLNRMQPSPQAMNLYGSQLMQQNQTALAGSSGAPCDVAVSENIQNIKTGQGKI
uniref:Uncharacterized protein n=1 Tax=Anthurium amnicola TaxID=1678845 RepID=A0A1D1Z2G2_9ARAE